MYFEKFDKVLAFVGKKLKDHTSGTSHLKCFSQWIQFQEGILNECTIDKKEVQLFQMETILEGCFRAAY